MTQQPPPVKPVPKNLNFLFGGSAGMLASSVVHPLDVMKNRLQIAKGSGEKETLVQCVRNIIKAQGIGGMYKGLTASLLRQATYTTARLGVFNTLNDALKSPDGKPPTFVMKLFIGIAAGTCGAIVGTPAEVCLIRMTTDSRLPPAERRNYTHVGNALSRIVKEEGVTTLWRGCIPTIIRAWVVNAVQLGTYAQTKEFLVNRKICNEGFGAFFTASMISGFLTSFTSVPVDILKTRVQNMKIVNGVPEYKNALDAFFKIISKEGVLSLWKGFIPYYARIGPHTVLTFLFLEKIVIIYRSI